MARNDYKSGCIFGSIGYRGIIMKLTFYKKKNGFPKEQTTLEDLLNVAAKNDMPKAVAIQLLFDPEARELFFPGIHLWAEG